MFKYLVRLAGVKFRPSTVRLQVEALREGAQLRLEREPDNSNDPNAIKVFPYNGSQWLGYVPRETAAILAPLMDVEGAVTTCVVTVQQMNDSMPTLRIEVA